jgi:uncharacterized metal-binding protein YceD (DUF177 family)
MPLLVNLRHLEEHNLKLEGQMPIEELDIETRDEAIQLRQPLEYAVEVQKLEGGLLLSGELRLILECRCVRCLKSFAYLLKLQHWTSHLPLHGEDAVWVNNDCVDLTPYIREDILLEFPPHPLCDLECGGLPAYGRRTKQTSSTGQPDRGSPAWDELNKLKF